MRKKVFTIEDHFQIKGRDGITIVGKKEQKDLELRPGMSVIFCRPDGREIETEVKGVELFSPPVFTHEAVLVSGLTKEDLPIGSGVFIVSAETTGN